MKIVRTIVGTLAAIASAGPISAVGAQEAPSAVPQEAPKASINMTLTETLKRLAPGPSTRDDIREIPPPKNDKLSDNTRVTVIVGDNCLPGEDMGVPRSFRRPTRAR